ncbi:transposase, partial [Streptococcus parauberis]
MEKVEELCLKYKFIYGYRTITSLLKKEFGINANVKKVYRIMKSRGWL